MCPNVHETDGECSSSGLLSLERTNASEAQVLPHVGGLQQVGLQLLRLLGLDVLVGLLEADEGSSEVLLPSVHLIGLPSLVHVVRADLAELRVWVDGVVVLVVDIGLNAATQAEEGKPERMGPSPTRQLSSATGAAASEPLPQQGLGPQRWLRPQQVAGSTHCRCLKIWRFESMGAFGVSFVICSEQIY